MEKNYNINIKDSSHVFTILTNRSEILIFTEILQFSKNGVDFYNTKENRRIILSSLSSLGKEIGETRFMSILKDIKDKNVLIWIEKGWYKINQDYIERV